MEIFECPFCQYQWRLGIEAAKENKNLKCPECASILGYWDKERLPIKKGYKVEIRKGVKVHSMKDGETKPAGKKYWVIVDHVLTGAHYPEYGKMVIKNPEIRWAGSGGYWNSVDINNIKYFDKNEKK